MKKYWMRKIPFVIAIAVAGIAVFSAIVMLLWNSILPSVLHVGTITFWQAAGLLLLAKLLFGGFRRRRHVYMAGRCGQKGMWHNCKQEPVNSVQ